MSDVKKVITVNANRETKPVGIKVFGIGAVVGPNATFSERIRYFDPNDLDAMALVLTGGTDAPEYKQAFAVASQPALLTEFAVIREDVGDADITESLDAAQNENGKFYGLVGVSRDPEIQMEIAAWILANKKYGILPSNDSRIITEAVTVDVVQRAHIVFDADLITANVFDCTVNTLPMVQVPFNTDHATTMTDISDAITVLSGDITATIDLILDPTGHTIKVVHDSAPVVITDAAVTLGVTQAATAIVYASIVARLKVLANDRVSAFYHGSAATEYLDGGGIGKLLPLPPGKYTANLKTISGVSVDELTASNSANAKDKFGNTYEEIGENNSIYSGLVSNGDFMDVVIFQDYLVAKIQESTFQYISTPLKVPYTEPGITGISGSIEQPIRLEMASAANPLGGVSPHHFDDDGVRDGGYEIILPDFSSISQADKTARILRNVKVKVWLSGAIHELIIDLTLTL